MSVEAMDGSRMCYAIPLQRPALHHCSLRMVDNVETITLVTRWHPTLAGWLRRRVTTCDNYGTLKGLRRDSLNNGSCSHFASVSRSLGNVGQLASTTMASTTLCLIFAQAEFRARQCITPAAFKRKKKCRTCFQGTPWSHPSQEEE